MAVTISGTTGVGVSTTPLYPSDILIGSIGTTAGAQVIGARLTGTSSNADILDISNVRGTAGTDWTTAGWRIQQKVDATWMGYIQFNGTPSGINSGGISFGTGSSTVSANSVTERLRIDASGNVTPGTTNTQTLGAVGDVWSNVYATTFTGALSGNATSAANLYGAGGNYIASSSNGTAYSAAIQIRESALGGAQASAIAAAPRLAFHWSGLVASSIALESTGRVAIYNNPGTAYEALACGNLYFNSGYGSAALAYGCRAWVNFNGAAAGTFTGGTVTVSRVAGSTTCSCTTANAHGLITGGTIYASLGNIVTPPYIPAGFYSVTVTGTNSFTFVNTQTAAIASATLVITVNDVRGDGNISSVSDLGIGNYALHFSTPMIDTNYAVLATVGWGAFASNAQNDAMPFTGEQTSTYFKLYIQSQPDGTFDPTFINAAVFR